MRFNPDIILAVPGFILSNAVHEHARALVATRCGVSTAGDRGRLTLDPNVAGLR